MNNEIESVKFRNKKKYCKRICCFFGGLTQSGISDRELDELNVIQGFNRDNPPYDSI